jgi:3-methyl-2-oxobutanoate hydroxymethyltransferase
MPVEWAKAGKKSDLMDEQRDTDSGTSTRAERVTLPALRQRKANDGKVVMVTAYDYPSARLADRAGVDMVLVGDSLGSVVLGYKTVVPVTMEEIIHHVRAVRRGLKHALLVADMPFGSYQASVEDAVRNATLLLKEGAQAVKLEGGTPMAPTIRRLTDVGIPVMGHLGLTPQSINMFGGHRAQGREPAAAQQIREDARGLEAAGAFGLVLETIPAALAAQITAEVSILTIGIGAGPECDGQVQVWHDLLGLTTGRSLRHAKRYASLGETAEAALRDYAEEVRQGRFPTKEHSL